MKKKWAKSAWIFLPFIIMTFCAGVLWEHYHLPPRNALKTLLSKDRTAEYFNGKQYITDSTRARLPHYENTIVEQLDSYSVFPPSKFTTEEGFQAFVKASLGWNNLHPAPLENGFPTISTGQKEEYATGNISENEIVYSRPPIRVHFLYARHEEKTSERSVIIVLHGHGSSSHKVMGIDNPDYMQTIGKSLFAKGFDVIALETTSDMEVSGYINGQLSLLGIQIYGLWARAVVDLVSALELRDKYKKVHLYGLSNGGVIANFVSVLSRDFDKIIVGDVLTSWKHLARRHPSFHRLQNYGLYFLRPLWFESNLGDFIEFSSPSTYFTRSEEKFASMPLGNEFEIDHGINHSSVNFVFKEIPFHIPEIGIIMKILTEDSNLRGMHLPIR